MAELLTTAEAAKVLGLSTGTLTIWRCVKRYPLPYVRVGRNIRYRAADLEHFLDSRTMPGVAEQNSRRRPRRRG
jgi:excisionase family DNA binding protein